MGFVFPLALFEVWLFVFKQQSSTGKTQLRRSRPTKGLLEWEEHPEGDCVQVYALFLLSQHPLLLLRHIVNNNLKHISTELSDLNLLLSRRARGVRFVYP